MIQNILNFIGDLHWLVWVALGLLALGLGLYAFRQYCNFKRSMNMIFLQIKIPRIEDEKEAQKEKDRYASSQDFKEVVGIMDHFFDNLYTVFHHDFEYIFFGQEFMSFEIAVVDGITNFYIVCPRQLENLIEKQITTFYSDALIERVDDYNIFKPYCKVKGYYMRFTQSPWLPFKSYQFTHSDPLSTITNVFSKFGKDEGGAIQIMVRPVPDGWQDKGREYAGELFGKGKEQKKFHGITKKILGPIWTLWNILFIGPEKMDSIENFDQEKNMTRTTPGIDEKVKAIENKCRKVGYETIIRIVASAPTYHQAKEHLTNIKSAFAQFASVDNNSLAHTKWCSTKHLVFNFIYRHLKRNWLQRIFQRKMICSSEELASLYHFPSIRYNKAPNINWLRYKIAPAPENVPH